MKPHDIDDILQETFIRAYAAAEKTEIRHPRSFMLRTARNLALNHVTSAYSRRTQMEDISSSSITETAEVVWKRSSSRRERFLGFCRAVRALPPQCRRVFVLRKVYGLTQQEIATYLHMSESTVEKHVAKGLSMCKDSMSAMGYAVGAAADDVRVKPKKGRKASNVVRFPNRVRAQEEALLWLARVDKGISTNEQAQLKQWLR